MFRRATFLFTLFWLTTCLGFGQTDHDQLQGAWSSEGGVLIVAGDYFSVSVFDKNAKTYTGTFGGHFKVQDGQIEIFHEYNTIDTIDQGTSQTLSFQKDGTSSLIINERSFTRIDDGTPGKLHGSWLFAGRKRDGKISERKPGPRKTMKILSGTRFQWIAYNTETGGFFGTGGGTYTTEDGKYVENIEFFSRDSSRVGASLSFDFELKDGKWHHSGKSSKGDPMYEIWANRD